MHYRLRDGLSFCFVGGRAIFLDLMANRYFALGTRDDACFQALMRNDERGAKEVAGRLARHGLLQASCEAGLLQPCVRSKPAEISLLDDADSESSALTRVRLSGRMIGTAILLRTRPLGQIIADLRAAKLRFAAQATDPVTDLAAQTHALEWTRRYLTSHELCLLRSLSLVRHLITRGVASELVFGVTTRPFRAHCWVEQGDAILNDRFDTVRNYTPILAA